MEKIIEIDISKPEELVEQYNKKKISNNLVTYLIGSVPRLKKSDTLKVIVNNNMKNNISCAEFIKQGLDSEIRNSDYRFINTNRRQVFLFVLGVLLLALAYVVNIEIIKEIILIGAWVLLWDMVELEINDDINNMKRKKILKRLVASEFEEIKK